MPATPLELIDLDRLQCLCEALGTLGVGILGLLGGLDVLGFLGRRPVSRRSRR